MLALKANCLHPTAQTPYIKSAIGGRDTSPEGYQVCFAAYSTYTLPSNIYLGRHHPRLHIRVRKRGGPEVLPGEGSGPYGVFKRSQGRCSDDSGCRLRAGEILNPVGACLSAKSLYNQLSTQILGAFVAVFVTHLCLCRSPVRAKNQPSIIELR
jgi:hypothetical protein